MTAGLISRSCQGFRGHFHSPVYALILLDCKFPVEFIVQFLHPLKKEVSLLNFLLFRHSHNEQLIAKLLKLLYGGFYQFPSCYFLSYDFFLKVLYPLCVILYQTSTQKHILLQKHSHRAQCHFSPVLSCCV